MVKFKIIVWHPTGKIIHQEFVYSSRSNNVKNQANELYREVMDSFYPRFDGLKLKYQLEIMDSESNILTTKRNF